MNSRLPLLAMALVAAMLLVGCQPFDHFDAATQQPVSPQAEPPRELAKVCLPAYVIEPPDMLSIEVLKLVPRPPYRIDVYDVLQIQVVNAYPDQPIDGFYLVEGEGTINIGPAYGMVRVAGMTVEEATQAVSAHLKQMLTTPGVSVQLARTSGTQSVTGVYLVAPDGTINMRQYGLISVAGKTLVQARLEIENQLRQYFDSPEVSIDMAGYNSKVYYIITAGAGVGDNVVRVPITGNETVLDAICQVNGLSSLSTTEIWVARPAPGGFGCEQILPVDWIAISRGGSASTNYQLMPGDRVFIADDKMLEFDNYLAKVTRPLERLLGITGLGATDIRSIQTMGRRYNSTRAGI